MKNVQKHQPSLGLLITLVGFPQISESIFTPILPALSHALRVSAGRSQLTLSVYFVASTLWRLPWACFAGDNSLTVKGAAPPCWGDSAFT